MEHHHLSQVCTEVKGLLRMIFYFPSKTIIVMNINSLIAKTYIVSKAYCCSSIRSLLVCHYIFMNSMMVGFDRSSTTSVFKPTAHIRVYKDDEIIKH